MTIRTPKTATQATALLEHYAELADAAAHIEARRNARIAEINAEADKDLLPLLPTLEEIESKIEPWWRAKGHQLAQDRRSAQLGGCLIGTRAGQPKLAHGFEDDDKAVEALLATRYATRTTRTKVSLDRAATLKALQLGGKTGEAIAALGFSVEQGETFSIKRVDQTGSIGA